MSVCVCVCGGTDLLNLLLAEFILLLLVVQEGGELLLLLPYDLLLELLLIRAGCLHLGGDREGRTRTSPGFFGCFSSCEHIAPLKLSFMGTVAEMLVICTDVCV